MPKKIEISPQTRERVIALRRQTGLANRRIADRLELTPWTVYRVLRDYRHEHSDDPLPVHRWSPDSRAMRKMALANRLVEENQLTRREVLARTGYKSWRALLDMVLLYRKRRGLGPMRHRSGAVKVAGKERTRIVLCAEAIDAVGWEAKQRIVWTVIDNEIWLTPDAPLTKSVARWRAGDVSAEVYWERYGEKIPWRKIAKRHSLSPTMAVKLARRHAEKYPWLPRVGRQDNRGVARVMRVNESTLRLNLNRAADLVGLKPGELAHWVAQSGGVLVVQRRTEAVARAI